MGQPSGKPVKKPYLQHRIGVVFRHRPIEHQLNNCMKTLREMMDLIESAQAPVAEGYTPTAGELARDLIKMPDSDFNKKYGMSKQQANRYYSSNKLKEPGMDEGLQTRTCPQCDGSGKDTLYHNKPCQRCNGKGHVPVNKDQDVAEGQKTDNRPASQFDREIVKAQPDGSCELKCGHKTSAKLSKNPVGKKIFCARCYELRNKEQAVDEDQATAKMGLMSAMGSNDNNPADQRRVMAQQAVEQLAAKR